MRPVTALARPIPIDPAIAADDDRAADLLHPLYRSGLARFPNGPIVTRGLPFEPPRDRSGGRWVVVDRSIGIEVPPAAPVSHLVVLGFCDAWRDDTGERPTGTPVGWVLPVGQPLAQLTVQLDVGDPVETTLRRRFEVNEGIIGWGSGAFLAMPHRAEEPVDPRGPHPRQEPGRLAGAGHAGPLTVLPGGWGPAQTAVQDHVPSATDELMLWLHAVDVRDPEGGVRVVRGIELAPLAGDGTGRLVVLAALTSFAGTDTPLRWQPRRALRVEHARQQPIEIDLGLVARRAPLGDAELLEVTAAADALLHVGDRTVPVARPSAGIVVLAPPDRQLEVRLTDLDGRATAARVRVVARDGRTLPPAGHQPDVNRGLYEDLGADVVVDDAAWAYVPGSSEVRVPAEGATIEAAHGFDVTPVRHDVTPGEVERGWIELAFGEPIVPVGEGWASGDTHVHFLSPSTALLQARAEGVNVVHLLATQWGDLHTSVTDLGGDQVDPGGRHAVWVGSENRQNMLGHVGIVGTRDARAPVRERRRHPRDRSVGRSRTWWPTGSPAAGRWVGSAIGAHFPLPMAEVAADIDAGLLDALELQCFDPTLESPPDAGVVSIPRRGVPAAAGRRHGQDERERAARPDPHLGASRRRRPGVLRPLGRCGPGMGARS